MIYTMLAGLLAAAAPQPEPPPSPPPPPPPALTDEMIKKAVREIVAEDPRPVDAANRSAGAYGAVTPHGRISAAFEQARVPDCLHDDALKHQPATIGPINVVGPYSLPWVIAAALRGKCN
ncbi:hypothetical protein [Duganella aceris]|uniref:DUF732 domain-containing protein n=1 Tax=Duganella aceris TaxID=2703883 RepID=A0ABX0FPA8_9BURK|nr:hypothetical protein [Duganella aceris]NGZ86323.1 hypothetical protein [Duganella aceris]